MPVNWTYSADVIRLGGHGGKTIGPADAERQEATAQSILSDLARQPGVILADEVGMGKTYVALAVIAYLGSMLLHGQRMRLLIAAMGDD